MVNLRNEHAERIKGWEEALQEERRAYRRLLERAETAEKERDEAQANYRFMVERAADQHLGGYRELGAKCAQLEAERDEARARAKALAGGLADLFDGASIIRVNYMLSKTFIVDPETFDKIQAGFPKKEGA